MIWLLPTPVNEVILTRYHYATFPLPERSHALYNWDQNTRVSPAQHLLKRIFLGFVEKPWVERLTDIGCLTREVVPLRKTALSLTAPFHQSCRSHVVFATQVEVKNIWYFVNAQKSSNIRMDQNGSKLIQIDPNRSKWIKMISKWMQLANFRFPFFFNLIRLKMNVPSDLITVMNLLTVPILGRVLPVPVIPVIPVTVLLCPTMSPQNLPLKLDALRIKNRQKFLELILKVTIRSS